MDLDILVGRGCVAGDVRALRDRGFRIAVAEPYTLTMERRGFIVDLYTEPAFAWVVYMDGGRLLRECSEDVELAGVPARGLSGGGGGCGCGGSRGVQGALGTAYGLSGGLELAGRRGLERSCGEWCRGWAGGDV